MTQKDTDPRRGLRARLLTIVTMLTMAVVTPTVAASCAQEGSGVFLGDDRLDSGSPSFVSTEDAQVDAETMISYCPSSACPAGFTTCPDSRYPCDVSLETDRDNCGACGSVCPSDGLGNLYTCAKGRCVQKCQGAYRDCDGIVDNGCEILPHTNDHCGECDVQCADPAKPCVAQPGVKGIYACGCPNDGLYCPRNSPQCVNPQNDDHNCGGCGVGCDPMGDGLPPPVNDTVSYGCSKGECGHLKCTFGNGNCDGDIESNGCETRITTSKNCGGCGVVCPSGQDCRFDATHQAFECKCPPGQTLCGGGCDGDVCWGECKDLASDSLNCGGCGITCSGRFDTKSIASCSYGSCTRVCLPGWADCNGNTADSCEVNTDSDPQNCGGCGITCDALLGQACVLGRCVVEPCDKDAGGPTR
ncbi:hypothetical protein [Labilithrix luteola]|nr:hypothetical protein [Labilithrix luteola]